MARRGDARKRPSREKRRRNLNIVALTCCFIVITWVRLISTGFSILSNDVSIQQQPSGSSQLVGPSFCNLFPQNITSYRFYPKQFFEDGPGRPFLPTVRHNRDNFTDILNARYLVFFSPNQEEDCWIVHYHIHKNGGTTLERHVRLKTRDFYSKRERELGHEKFEEATSRIMKAVYLRQLPNRTTAEPSLGAVRTFTFIRDPVTRFLSSVAQVLKLRAWHTRLYPCYQENTTGPMLDCVLDKLETGSFPEMHLAPQSFELYKQTMGLDIHVDLMSLSDIGRVMEQLGATDVPKERSTTGRLIRRFPQFEMSMNFMTPERIQRVCNVYAADVQMLKLSGVADTLCP